MVANRCRPMDVDMMSDDKGLNAWCGRFRSPASSAFEGPLPPSQLRWFPRVDFIGLAFGHIRRSLSEEWLGTHVCLLAA